MQIDPQDLGALREELDKAAKKWRQGDVFVRPGVFPVVTIDSDAPLSDTSAAAAERGAEGIVVIRHTDARLAIVSQSCDVVGSFEKTPHIALAPVIEIEETVAVDASKGYKTSLAPLPALGDRFAADLDRIFTVEKTVLRGVELKPGFRSDEEARLFQAIVHRHFSRTAFPDDVEKSIDPLRRRFRQKKGKDSTEGRAIDSIEEVRLAMYPSSTSSSIVLTIHLLLLDAAAFSRILSVDEEAGQKADPLDLWEKQIENWKQFVSCVGVVKEIEFDLDHFERFTYQQVRDSDSWDPADALSPPLVA